MKPFIYQEVKPNNTIQKILKPNRKIELIIQIKNYLSERELNEISKDEIDIIFQEYEQKLHKKTILELNNIFKEFISYYLNEIEVSEIDFVEIEKLSDLLRITKEFRDEIIQENAKKRFRVEVIQLLINGKSVHENKDEIDNLQKILRINEDDFKEIVDTERVRVVKEYFSKAIKDGRYSPEEEEGFYELVKKLDVSPTFNDDTIAIIQKSKKLWEIENQSLSTINVNINLSQNEKCFHSTYADYYEYRTVTKKINYNGPTLRVKIMKGFYYRIGNFNTSKETEEVLKKIDTGRAYITNRRIIFIGSNRTYSILLKKILDMEPFSDGIKIMKDTGRNIFLRFNNEIDLFTLILARVVKDYCE